MKLQSLLLTIALMITVPVFTTTHASAQDDGTSKVPPSFVTLNTHMVLEDSAVRLGDLFQGVEKHGERVVAQGPRPGGRSVFDARWLLRVAAAYGVDWRPTSSSERAVIERASQIVGKDEIVNLLQERLVAEGGDPNSRVSLSNRSFALHLPVGQDYLLGIDQLHFDQASGRFSATLAWGSGKSERRRVVGRMEHMSAVPVLRQHITKDNVLTPEHIEWMDMPSDRLSRNTILDEDRLIGMAVKRSIQPGKPLTTSDIRRPLVVSKGEMVTMVLQTAAMRLTAKGKALEDGGTGDTIRISNSQTNTVIEGVVTAPGRIRVDGPVNLAMR